MITLQHFYTIVVWCNGSTTGFGSVCRGSNPRTTTRIRAVLVTALILLESLHAFSQFLSALDFSRLTALKGRKRTATVTFQRWRLFSSVGTFFVEGHEANPCTGYIVTPLYHIRGTIVTHTRSDRDTYEERSLHIRGTIVPHMRNDRATYEERWQ